MNPILPWLAAWLVVGFIGGLLMLAAVCSQPDEDDAVFLALTTFMGSFALAYGVLSLTIRVGISWWRARNR